MCNRLHDNDSCHICICAKVVEILFCDAGEAFELGTCPRAFDKCQPST